MSTSSSPLLVIDDDSNELIGDPRLRSVWEQVRSNSVIVDSDGDSNDGRRSTLPAYCLKLELNDEISPPNSYPFRDLTSGSDGSKDTHGQAAAPGPFLATVNGAHRQQQVNSVRGNKREHELSAAEQERRRRHNMACRRSRDNQRQRINTLEEHVCALQGRNLRLETELRLVRTEQAWLKGILQRLSATPPPPPPPPPRIPTPIYHLPPNSSLILRLN